MSYNPGTTGISGASDVFLNAPGTSDVLSYNASTGKWQNTTLDKTRVGLSNVDNTSDVNKPVSTAAQTALNSKASVNQARPEIRYTSTGWPTRSSAIPSGYTGPVTWWSGLDTGVTAPTDATAGDDWVERVS